MQPQGTYKNWNNFHYSDIYIKRKLNKRTQFVQQFSTYQEIIRLKPTNKKIMSFDFKKSHFIADMLFSHSFAGTVTRHVSVS